jgi:integrase/recombinase XerD
MRQDYDVSAKDIKYLEPEQVHRVIENIDNTTSKNPERDRLIVEIMWRTGARISEALQLIYGNVISNEFGNIIKMKNLKQVKKDKAKRVLTEFVEEDGIKKRKFIHDTDATKEIVTSKEFCQKIIDYCIKLKLKKDDYIFSYPRSKTGLVTRLYVWRMLNRASIKANIEIFGKKDPRSKGGAKGAYPHMFRHSNAMHLLDKTNNIKLVQQELGHSSVNTTQVYTFVKTKDIEKQIENIEW